MYTRKQEESWKDVSEKKKKKNIIIVLVRLFETQIYSEQIVLFEYDDAIRNSKIIIILRFKYP